MIQEQADCYLLGVQLLCVQMDNQDILQFHKQADIITYVRKAH